MSSRRNRSLAPVATACALALAGAAAPPASASPAFFTFGYTGGVQNWVVPAGVTHARIDLYGAGGGEPHSDGFHPGRGGRALTDYYELTPGTTVHVVVGGKGGMPDNHHNGAGYNGGGPGRFGGGGGTDIRIGGTGLANRVLVAGGAGGHGPYGGQTGGAGGGLTGGGAGGTQTAGGVGSYPMWSGWLGHGGPGANAGPNIVGGGGGGWYGGAGSPGAGGGGSGHGTNRTHFESGVEAGNGHARITIGPPTGYYSGADVYGTSVSLRLSHDYSTVTSFRWFDQRNRFETATFHQAGTRGSFSQWVGADTHYWGHWEGSTVTGGISYLAGGARVVRHYTLRRDYTA